MGGGSAESGSRNAEVESEAEAEVEVEAERWGSGCPLTLTFGILTPFSKFQQDLHSPLYHICT